MKLLPELSAEQTDELTMVREAMTLNVTSPYCMQLDYYLAITTNKHYPNRMKLVWCELLILGSIVIKSTNYIGQAYIGVPGLLILVIRTLHGCPSQMNENVMPRNAKSTSDNELIVEHPLLFKLWRTAFWVECILK